jgi:hypothetical protein
MNPIIENLEVEKDKRGLLVVEPTLQLRDHPNVFILGDIASYPDVAPTLAGTAQLALQQAHLCARNVRASLSGDELKTKHFVELGEALSLGTEHAAVLSAGKVMAGPLARKRVSRCTRATATWHHRTAVGASWFFEARARDLAALRFLNQRALLILCVFLCAPFWRLCVKLTRQSTPMTENEIAKHVVDVALKLTHHSGRVCSNRLRRVHALRTAET